MSRFFTTDYGSEPVDNDLDEYVDEEIVEWDVWGEDRWAAERDER